MARCPLSISWHLTTPSLSDCDTRRRRAAACEGGRQSAPRTMSDEAYSHCKVGAKRNAAYLFKLYLRFTRGMKRAPQPPARAGAGALRSRLTHSSVFTQACKRHRLLTFFNPGQACCAECLAVRSRRARTPIHPIVVVIDLAPSHLSPARTAGAGSVVVSSSAAPHAGASIQARDRARCCSRAPPISTPFDPPYQFFYVTRLTRRRTPKSSKPLQSSKPLVARAPIACIVAVARSRPSDRVKGRARVS